MGQWVKPDGTKVESPWQERRNVQGWVELDGGKIPIPFTCECCHQNRGLYGDEDGIHCIPCWVAKKEGA